MTFLSPIAVSRNNIFLREEKFLAINQLVFFLAQLTQVFLMFSLKCKSVQTWLQSHPVNSISSLQQFDTKNVKNSRCVCVFVKNVCLYEWVCVCTCVCVCVHVRERKGVFMCVWKRGACV